MEGLPVKLWGLDPLYWSHIKLFIIEIFELPRYPGFQGLKYILRTCDIFYAVCKI